MINKAIYQDHIKIQYFFYLVVLVMYQFFDGIYRSYYISNKILKSSLESEYRWGFDAYKNAVLFNALVWMVFIVALILMQFHILRKKENASFMGSLPITRKSLICTTYLSGVSVLGIGFAVHFMAVLGQNSAGDGINAMLIASLLRAGLFFLFVYTILFATETFVVKNKWWLTFGTLTVVSAVAGIFTTKLLSGLLPHVFFDCYYILCDKLDILKEILTQYVLIDNTFYLRMPENHMAVYSILTTFFVIMILLFGILSVWFYDRTDEANSIAVFAVHIPRGIVEIYGVFVGYCVSAVPVYIFLLVSSVVAVLLGFTAQSQGAAGNIYNTVNTVVMVIVMCGSTIAGGILARSFAKKRDAKEGR